MGFRDELRKATQEQTAVKAEQDAFLASITVGCPGDHYLTEVNKGSIRMQTWQSHLNDMYQRGYRLAHTFEQDGNTVQVFEHHFH